jgi:hypothetical protein
MDTAVAKNQSHTLSMWWIISIVPESPVSNLLALLGWQPTRFKPDNPRPRAAITPRIWLGFSRRLFFAESREVGAGVLWGSPAEHCFSTLYNSFRHFSTTLGMFDNFRQIR